MGTELTPMQEFQDRVKEKLKADIGALIPDEALQELTKRAVEEQFFQERRIRQQYGQDKFGPSWFVEEVAKIAKPMIEEHIKTYVEENRGEIEEAIKKYLSDQNLALTTSAMISQQMSAFMLTNVDMIVNNIINHPGRM